MKWIIGIVAIVFILLFIWVNNAIYHRDLIYAGEIVLIGILVASNYIRVKARNGVNQHKGSGTPIHG